MGLYIARMFIPDASGREVTGNYMKSIKLVLLK